MSDLRPPRPSSGPTFERSRLPRPAARHLAALAVLCVLGACAAPHPEADELNRMFSEGVSWDVYVAEHEDRRDAWVTGYEQVVTDPVLLERARAVPGSWRLLAVVAPWCPDSQATASALERIAEETVNLELRLVNAEGGHPIKDAHLTPDGRGSTPTILLMDETGTERGCLVEMPDEMLRWWVGEGLDTLAHEVTRDQKLEWYRNDGGRAAWTDLVLMMEAAARDEMRCAPHEAEMQ